MQELRFRIGFLKNNLRGIDIRLNEFDERSRQYKYLLREKRRVEKYIKKLSEALEILEKIKEEKICIQI